ncbi:disulfide bond formation protein DsbA [Halorubrum salipaludis]|uniref:Disulfide bond formation protein DsbA n=1 Tax=Halorubrum salipaludis TaxID=2032630 RepID=A0A2A2FCQ2_9EURY|nr:DsbA family protein [Halorubrum salipaludis]PAU83271.1 disulfide bond formation protein DsbA [Halorubrum salipaludis]
MDDSDDAVAIYSDYVCPFCYLGRRSLAAYQETRDRELAIGWRPYDLRGHKRGPDGEIIHSIDDGKDEGYFERVRRDVDRLRDEYGAEAMLDLDDLPERVDSFDAQVASLYVSEARPDRWLDFDEAIFEALWVDGREIGDADVLADLAEGVGIEGNEIRSAIRDEDRRARLRSAFAEARDAKVGGVPTFEYEGRTARGALSPDQLRQLVEGV